MEAFDVSLAERSQRRWTLRMESDPEVIGHPEWDTPKVLIYYLCNSLSSNDFANSFNYEQIFNHSANLSSV